MALCVCVWCHAGSVHRCGGARNGECVRVSHGGGARFVEELAADNVPRALAIARGEAGPCARDDRLRDRRIVPQL